MSGQAWKYSDQLDDMDLKMMKRDFFTYKIGMCKSSYHQSTLNSNLFLSLFLNYTRDLKLFLLVYCSKISLKKIIKKFIKNRVSKA